MECAIDSGKYKILSVNKNELSRMRVVVNFISQATIEIYDKTIGSSSTTNWSRRKSIVLVPLIIIKQATCLFLFLLFISTFPYVDSSTTLAHMQFMKNTRGSLPYNLYTSTKLMEKHQRLLFRGGSHHHQICSLNQHTDEESSSLSSRKFKDLPTFTLTPPSTASAWRETTLLALFYFIQTAPKGYLSMLPILLRRHQEGSTSFAGSDTVSVSFKTLATLSLVSLPDLFKPIAAIAFDRFVPNSAALVRVITVLEGLLIATVASFSLYISNLSSSRGAIMMMKVLMIHFVGIHILTMLHDTAVDGLAVTMLTHSSSAPKNDRDGDKNSGASSSNMSNAALGQYIGYKLGGIVVSGLLPLLIDYSLPFLSPSTAIHSYHKVFCVGILLVMSLSFCSILSLSHSLSLFSIPLSSSPDVRESKTEMSVIEREQSHILTISRLRSLLLSSTNIILILVLLGYKTGEHALDYLWTTVLVDRQVDRKSIVATQMVLGGIAALVGASLGRMISGWTNRDDINNSTDEQDKKKVIVFSSLKAVAICSILRLIPEAFQVYFVSPYYKTDTNGNYVHNYVLLSIHAIAENIFGSALTSTMFMFLLMNSDPLMPSTSYAVMNTLAMLGMQIGKYMTRFADVRSSSNSDTQSSNVFVFSLICWFVNSVYSVFVSYIAYNTNLLK